MGAQAPWLARATQSEDKKMDDYFVAMCVAKMAHGYIQVTSVFEQFPINEWSQEAKLAVIERCLGFARDPEMSAEDFTAATVGISRTYAEENPMVIYEYFGMELALADSKTPTAALATAAFSTYGLEPNVAERLAKLAAEGIIPKFGLDEATNTVVMVESGVVDEAEAHLASVAD